MTATEPLLVAINQMREVFVKNYFCRCNIAILIGLLSFHFVFFPLLEENIKTQQSLPLNSKNTLSIYNYNKECIDSKHIHHHKLIIAGLFNTGTNALWNYIHPNCNNFDLLWQPEWGKHIAINGTIIDKHWNDTYMNLTQNIVVVLIKDPLTWIKSICKSAYAIIFDQREWQKHCPQNISQSSLTLLSKPYKSLISLWNEYYQSYLDANNEKNSHHIHFLILKFEDLLFESTKIIHKLCHCFKDSNVTDMIYSGVAKDHGNSRNKSSAMRTYSDPHYRYSDYTKQDLQYIYDNVNHTILKTFGYEFDRLYYN
eukprot:510569_1